MLVEEISLMLQRELKDPRLGFITVTGAEITRDLRYAKVFVSILGSDEEKQAAMAGLKSATGLIRGKFGRLARLRLAPEIQFQQDTGIARGSRIFELLHQIEEETPPKTADQNPTTEGTDDG